MCMKAQIGEVGDQPRNSKDCWKPPEAEGKNMAFADTLISDC